MEKITNPVGKAEAAREMLTALRLLAITDNDRQGGWRS